MAIPTAFHGRLTAPAIVAPMFLVSGPDLVVEACRSGFVGTFPALNQRTSDGYESWLSEITERLRGSDLDARPPAPYGVNLIVHRSNPRLQPDLEITAKHRVPLVITSLGAVREVIETVHAYGGLVFHDVVNALHARKAAEAGVDGLIAVCAGAGGHAGTLSPFALLSEIRTFFDGTLVLSGAITHGRHIAGATAMGADLAYMGTRFIATKESLASDKYKSMILGAAAKDIVYTPRISGVPASFLRASLEAAGLDPDNLPPKEEHGISIADEAKAWKDIWSAGQGVGTIEDIPTVAELCARLALNYRQAAEAAAVQARAFAGG